MIAGVIRLIRAQYVICGLLANTGTPFWPLTRRVFLYAVTQHVDFLEDVRQLKKGNVSNLDTEECFSLGWQGFLPSI